MYITLLLYALLRQQHYILRYKTFTKLKNELLEESYHFTHIVRV